MPGGRSRRGAGAAVLVAEWGRGARGGDAGGEQSGCGVCSRRASTTTGGRWRRHLGAAATRSSAAVGCDGGDRGLDVDGRGTRWGRGREAAAWEFAGDGGGGGNWG